MVYKIVMLLSLVLSVGCATNKQEGKAAELSKVGIEKNLVKGKSSKVDVIKLLGSPEMINMDSDHKEQWVYSKSETAWNEQHGGMGALGIGFLSSALLGVDANIGGSNATKKQRMKTLTVNFNNRGIMESFQFSYSKI